MYILVSGSTGRHGKITVTVYWVPREHLQFSARAKHRVDTAPEYRHEEVVGDWITRGINGDHQDVYSLQK